MTRVSCTEHFLDAKLKVVDSELAPMLYRDGPSCIYPLSNGRINKAFWDQATGRPPATQIEEALQLSTSIYNSPRVHATAGTTSLCCVVSPPTPQHHRHIEPWRCTGSEPIWVLLCESQTTPENRDNTLSR